MTIFGKICLTATLAVIVCGLGAILLQGPALSQHLPFPGEGSYESSDVFVSGMEDSEFMPTVMPMPKVMTKEQYKEWIDNLRLSMNLKLSFAEDHFIFTSKTFIDAVLSKSGKENINSARFLLLRSTNELQSVVREVGLLEKDPERKADLYVYRLAIKAFEQRLTKFDNDITKMRPFWEAMNDLFVARKKAFPMGENDKK